MEAFEIANLFSLAISGLKLYFDNIRDEEGLERLLEELFERNVDIEIIIYTIDVYHNRVKKIAYSDNLIHILAKYPKVEDYLEMSFINSLRSSNYEFNITEDPIQNSYLLKLRVISLILIESSKISDERLEIVVEWIFEEGLGENILDYFTELAESLPEEIFSKILLSILRRMEEDITFLNALEGGKVESWITSVIKGDI